MTKIAEVCTDQLVTVTPDDSVSRAAELMKEHDIGDVLIIEGRKPAGILTDRDITVRVLGEGRDPADTTCGDVGTTDLMTIRMDQEVSEAVEMMSEGAIRRLPVVDEQGEPCGMVTIGDLAEDRDPESVLADISEAPANN